MKSYKHLSFSQKIRLRLAGLWAALVGLLILMVAAGELGLADPRIIGPMADQWGTLLFFGSLIYVCFRIRKNKKLLSDSRMLKEKQLLELDERNQYIHDKSGGLCWDIFFPLLMLSAILTSLVSREAFSVSFALLCLAAAIKAGLYWYYEKHA